ADRVRHSGVWLPSTYRCRSDCPSLPPELSLRLPGDTPATYEVHRLGSGHAPRLSAAADQSPRDSAQWLLRLRATAGIAPSRTERLPRKARSVWFSRFLRSCLSLFSALYWPLHWVFDSLPDL